MDISEQPLVDEDLTDDERRFIGLLLNEYGGPAKRAYQLLCPVVGLSNEDEWDRLIQRLMTAIKNKEPLSDLDWARTLFLAEISYGSNLVGSGLDFGTSRDNEWIALLRSIQRKLSGYERFRLLVENTHYSPSPTTP
jgi:hypothetical protein